MQPQERECCRAYSCRDVVETIASEWLDVAVPDATPSAELDVDGDVNFTPIRLTLHFESCRMLAEQVEILYLVKLLRSTVELHSLPDRH